MSNPLPRFVFLCIGVTLFVPPSNPTACWPARHMDCMCSPSKLKTQERHTPSSCSTHRICTLVSTSWRLPKMESMRWCKDSPSPQPPLACCWAAAPPCRHTVVVDLSMTHAKSVIANLHLAAAPPCRNEDVPCRNEDRFEHDAYNGRHSQSSLHWLNAGPQTLQVAEQTSDGGV